MGQDCRIVATVAGVPGRTWHRDLCPHNCFTDMTKANRPEEQGHTGLVVEEAAPETRQPPLYSVVLLNDDYTPMEFVVDVLERFFRLDRESATRVMLEVHMKGKGVCGVFTYEIAETKVAQVMTYSRDNLHPLMCPLEQA